MKYTTIVRYPDYMSDDGQLYSAWVEADTAVQAAREGQLQAFYKQSREDRTGNRADDFKVEMVVEGHITIELWGWQL